MKFGLRPEARASFANRRLMPGFNLMQKAPLGVFPINTL